MSIIKAYKLEAGQTQDTFSPAVFTVATVTECLKLRYVQPTKASQTPCQPHKSCLHEGVCSLGHQVRG
jgi:hypothetical protein